MKAGKSSDIVAVLPSLRDEGLGRLEGVVLGGDAADQLDELHARHRVHEMNADEALGIGGDGGEPGDRDRRGVGGDDRLRFQERAQVGEDLALDVLVLRTPPRSPGRSRRDRRTRRRRRCGRAPPARPASSSCPLAIWRDSEPLIVASAALTPLFGDVVEHHVQSGLRADQRDAGAHLTRADDADFVDRELPFAPSNTTPARARS